eukprot:6746562-Pyramimonas_sp.AAC.1
MSLVVRPPTTPPSKKTPQRNVCSGIFRAPDFTRDHDSGSGGGGISGNQRSPRDPVVGSAVFGLPQRRPRIYILGVHESLGCEPRLRKPPRPAITPVSQLLSADKG